MNQRPLSVPLSHFLYIFSNLYIYIFSLLLRFSVFQSLALSHHRISLNRAPAFSLSICLSIRHPLNPHYLFFSLPIYLSLPLSLSLPFISLSLPVSHSLAMTLCRAWQASTSREEEGGRGMRGGGERREEEEYGCRMRRWERSESTKVEDKGKAGREWKRMGIHRRREEGIGGESEAPWLDGWSRSSTPHRSSFSTLPRLGLASNGLKHNLSPAQEDGEGVVVGAESRLTLTHGCREAYSTKWLADLLPVVWVCRV